MYFTRYPNTQKSPKVDFPLMVFFKKFFETFEMWLKFNFIPLWHTKLQLCTYEKLRKHSPLSDFLWIPIFEKLSSVGLGALCFLFYFAILLHVKKLNQISFKTILNYVFFVCCVAL